MRIVIQRVKKAKVIVRKTGKVSGQIDQGMFVLLGIGKEDNNLIAEKLVKKLVNMRIFTDSKGLMNLSLMETKFSILLVSQFTLYGDTRKGNRPSFIKAEAPDKARELYECFINELEKFVDNFDNQNWQ